MVWVFLHSNFFGGLRMMIFLQECILAFPVHPVIDFSTNLKCVCDFLLVRRSNLGPILHRFVDIAGFCAHDPHLYSP